MRKTGAILLLLVAVLWAATPAFACFAPVQAHGCCSHQMRDCNMASMTAGATCCQVRSQNESEQPAAGTTFQVQVELAQVSLPVDAMVPPVGPAAVWHSAETPPPIPPGDIFILRI